MELARRTYGKVRWDLNLQFSNESSANVTSTKMNCLLSHDGGVGIVWRFGDLVKCWKCGVDGGEWGDSLCSAKGKRLSGMQ